MNPSSDSRPEAIRSDIDVTRRRMDDTMDALGERLQPRHLLDEFLGFLRGSASDGESRLTHLREKVSHSAQTAMHSVTDTVKKNPVPVLLIGAGVAWMIYESRRDPSRSDNEMTSDKTRDDLRYDPDLHYDRPLEYPPSLGAEEESKWSDQGGSKIGQIGEKISDTAASAKEGIKDKLSRVGDVAREKTEALREQAGQKLEAAKDRASEVAARVKDTTRDAYVRTRERVVETADQHPLEIGLVALAAGLIAGLALPTPRAVNRRLGPTADRLRERAAQAGTEMIEKGKRVAQAAAAAAKNEAEAQGLMPDKLGEKAAAVAEHATEASEEAAHREGLTGGNQSGSQQFGDPTLARPAN